MILEKLNNDENDDDNDEGSEDKHEVEHTHDTPKKEHHNRRWDNWYDNRGTRWKAKDDWEETGWIDYTDDKETKRTANRYKK